MLHNKVFGYLYTDYEDSLPLTTEDGRENVQIRFNDSILTTLSDFARVRSEFSSFEIDECEHWAVGLFAKVYPRQLAKLVLLSFGRYKKDAALER